jgi:hypothetical protein
MNWKLKRLVLGLATIVCVAIVGAVVPQSGAAAAVGGPSHVSTPVGAPGASIFCSPNPCFRIQMANSNFCLDADTSSGGFYPGDKVQLYTCGGQVNQYWLWDGQNLRNAADPHYCLDVDLNTPAAQSADGHKVWIWTCANQADQRWSWNANGTLQSHWNGKCVDAFQFGIGNGDPISLYGCVAKQNQEWVAA